jgi:hypothetical protein
MNYELKIRENQLVFKTTSFMAEKGSLLHSGIYNHELASSLASGACIALLGFFFASSGKITTSQFVLSIALFVFFFLFFRRYVFIKPYFELVIDKSLAIIEILVKKPFIKHRSIYPLSEVDLRVDKKTFEPENQDGIRLVEKVALQHGTVIPGFGERSEFYTLQLNIRNEMRAIIFSSEDSAAVNEISAKIKNFIER